jgi:hypothetical protein
MSYHHKRKSCSKKTREIIEEILQMQKAEYRMVEFASTVSETKPESIDNGTANPLPGSGENAEVDFEELESYEPTDKIDCEAATVKESFEKKKKKRNYIEFRPDYISA